MKYPQLVRDKDCTVPISVTIEQEGLDENGGPLIGFTADLYCNWQDTAKRILTDEQKIVQITGTAYFNGDIAPALPVLSGGKVTVFGVERRIAAGMKARNPDGTVNYTKLEVI